MPQPRVLPSCLAAASLFLAACNFASDGDSEALTFARPHPVAHFEEVLRLAEGDARFAPLGPSTIARFWAGADSADQCVRRLFHHLRPSVSRVPVPEFSRARPRPAWLASPDAALHVEQAWSDPEEGQLFGSGAWQQPALALFHLMEGLRNFLPQRANFVYPGAAFPDPPFRENISHSAEMFAHYHRVLTMMLAQLEPFVERGWLQGRDAPLFAAYSKIAEELARCEAAARDADAAGLETSLLRLAERIGEADAILHRA